MDRVVQRRVWAILLPLVIASLAVARSQVPEFPDSLRQNGFSARTERFELTHTTMLLGDQSLSLPSLDGLIRLQALSSTTLLANSPTRDQIDLLVEAEGQIPSSLRPFGLVEGTLTNDVRHDALIPGLDNTAAFFSGAGVRLRDDRDNRVGLAVGGAYNRQLNVEDVGLGIYAEASGSIDIDGTALRGDARFRSFNVSPRKNVNGYAELLAQHEFEQGARGQLSFRYDLIGTDLYIKRSEIDVAADGGLSYSGLLGRGEQRLRIGSALLYPLGDDVELDMAFALNNFIVDQQELTEGLPPLPQAPDPFGTGRGVFGLALSAGITWNTPVGTLGGRIEYISSEQINTVEAVSQVSDAELNRRRQNSAQNDYASGQLRLAGTVALVTGRRDTFAMNGSVGIYRYDTPSRENAFDRDEQSIQGEVRYSSRLSPYLNASLTGQIFLTHLVYLFGQNSNDNNWNRIFRLAPSVVWSPGDWLVNHLDAQVVANYTAYDFQGRSQNIRGRSSRELRIADSLKLKLTSTLGLEMYGDLRIAERGSFSWEDFAESPTERTRTEGLESGLTTTLVEGTLFGVGGRLARVRILRADPRTGIMAPFSDRTSIGPTARMEIHLSSATAVIFTGWWEHRFEESRLVGTLPWLWLEAVWRP